MKTITFYSYKGGVGRTLALSNMAKRLTEFGKKVCILDLDLEAPGLQVKLENQLPKDGVKTGIVDYIYEFSAKDILPNKISNYATKLEFPNNMYFLAAGNSNSNEYWKKLTQLNWWKFFYSEKSEGIPFFLDLKEKIKLEYNPDYLLIDSRTGITELSAITISILADSVVVFAANNKENINGCKHVLNSISKSENNLFNVRKDIHFVLSRIPLPLKPDEKTKEEALTKKIFSEFIEFEKNENIKMKSYSVLHSDRELEFDECLKIGYDFDKKIGSISTEYLNLFNNLTANDLSEEEKIQFNRIKECESIVRKVSLNKEFDKSLNMLDKAILLDPQNSDIYFSKGVIYINQQNYNEALKQFNIVFDLEHSSFRSLYGRSVSYYKLKKYKNALDDLEQAKKIYNTFDVQNLLIRTKSKLSYSKSDIFRELDDLVLNNPNISNAFNARANFFREAGKYEEAIEDVYKALRLDTENGLAYSTLAEINVSQNEIQEFYRNFELALKYGFNSKQIFDDEVKNLYTHFFTNDIFLKILDKYDQYKTLDLIEDYKSSV